MKAAGGSQRERTPAAPSGPRPEQRRRRPRPAIRLLTDALDSVRAVVGHLGIEDDAHTAELCTDAVAARRADASTTD
ncbi:hypothetical protein ABIA38_005489 [Embleya sp. AB8]